MMGSEALNLSTKGRYPPATSAMDARAAKPPAIMPSSRKGPRTNQSVAPTSFMTSISFRRTKTAVRIDIMMMKTETAVKPINTAAPTIARKRLTSTSLPMTSCS